MSQSVVAALNRVIYNLEQADMCLRNGQVIYAYRQIGLVKVALASPLDADGSKIRTVNLIQARLKKGEQIDAYDSIKSLTDQCKTMRQAVLDGDDNGKNQQRKNPPGT